MNRPVVRVALVEDHVLLRALLAERLEREDDLVLTASVGTAAEAEQQMLDVGLPDGDGILLGLALQRADPELRVLLLSAHDVLAPMLVTQRRASVPWSFLSKRSALAAERLADTVRTVAEGRSVIDPALDRSACRQRDAISGLNATQARVLRLVSQGLTNTAIAEALCLTTKAVEACLTTIYRLLGVAEDQNSRVSAVLAYQRHADQEDHAGGGVAGAPRRRH
jgi:DNA-binding NarL/FixJ family response regulator